jgi:hypothetical protein
MDAAKIDFSKGKTRYLGGRSKSRKIQEITYFYYGKPNHKKSDSMTYKRDLAEGKVANKNEHKARMVPL